MIRTAASTPRAASRDLAPQSRPYRKARVRLRIIWRDDRMLVRKPEARAISLGRQIVPAAQMPLEGLKLDTADEAPAVTERLTGTAGVSLRGGDPPLDDASLKAT